ncbi:MAG: sigma-70 family RNA polymerase sigma factor [Acidimicrobiia bacterium]|nr:sigma-70 family RNA polymerase sigma factor [Acidimicrobiia bacterium]
METDRQRFERVYDDCYDAILRYCLRRSSREDALDAAAETFLVAWRRRADLPVGRELPWLYGVARRVVANQRRGRLRQVTVLASLRSVDEPDDGPETLVVQHSEITDLIAALDRLSPKDREVVCLAGWEELDRDELALAVGCTPNAATKRLNRALDRLGHELGVVERKHVRFFRRGKVAS